MSEATISVVTPTLGRPQEVGELLDSLAVQTLLPTEVILVDGAPEGVLDTEEVVTKKAGELPFPCRYLRHPKGTAIQRNAGIELATGDLIALLDDDVRPEADYLENLIRVFEEDTKHEVGGVVAYRTNKYFHPDSAARWRWYRRLGLLREFEPGRYDFACGYPVNAFMQPPFEGTREVDFMTTACALWRRQVFDEGLSFDPFFRDYGVLEDAHFSLRARRRWRLLQCGDARCRELSATGGREDRRLLGKKCVVNYYYVFRDVAGPLSLGQRFRFWRFQAVELLRLAASALWRRRMGDLRDILGRLEGTWAVATGSAFRSRPEAGETRPPTGEPFETRGSAQEGRS
ncbi:MAG: glycosyltransferase family 2 protein [Acidobacteria bacterium]|nr:glycosyltransferase family 2 protein [Acidobacteriota bacterium]